MNFELFFPPDHPSLLGHFPGNPIVPAVVIIQEVARRLEAETGVRIDEVRQLRLQQPLLPGQPVLVHCEPKGADAWRVTLKVGAALIARGIFGQREGILPVPALVMTGDRTPRSGAEAYQFLPHSEDMALIDAFEVDNNGRAHTSIRHFPAHPLEVSDRLTPWVALEYAAQLYGCLKLMGAEQAPSEAAMTRAFIVLVRSLQINASRQPGIGQCSELVLQVVTEQENAAQCEFEMQVDGYVSCRGEFTVMSGR